MDKKKAAMGIFGMLKKSAKDFSDDECPRMAAALSYYTVFALPPLIILILLIVGAIWDPADVREALTGQMGNLMGAAGKQEVTTMMEEADNPATKKGVAAVLGVFTLLLGATGAFLQLQSALNRAWEVEPDKTQGGIKNFVFKRLLSVGMVLTIAFLLLVSLLVSSVLSAMGGALEAMLPWFSGAVAFIIENGVSLAVITLLFGLIFKVLPDARIAWKDVWIGAAFTALLFVIGKFGLGLYLGRSNPGQAYGAAGSLAVMLVWIYYSAMIVLFGAEFTQTWAVERGSGIEPEKGAKRMDDETPDQMGGGKGGKKGKGGKRGEPIPPAGQAPGDAVDAARAAHDRAERRAS
ncbi:MAG TPA: YihY/virulence factor BrkB family protein [Longimicrobium sp.]|nr:YihY/virulence factor BrkB family protein [Longimicrobium sp.]